MQDRMLHLLRRLAEAVDLVVGGQWIEVDADDADLVAHETFFPAGYSSTRIT